MAIPKNPNRIRFVASTDHDSVEYEVDFVPKTTGQVVRTVKIGRPPIVNQETREAEADINVQPTTFGLYHSIVRAFVSGITSEDSNPSNDWERAPGKPGQVTVG